MAALMNDLKEHYSKHGISATGTFANEIYASSPSDFWFSMGYKQTTVRIDLYWFMRNEVNPATDYYPQFWELLAKYDYRLHWGKFMPNADWRTPEIEGRPDISNLPVHEYLKKQYPKWDAWMDLREKMDPNGIFLTNYWKGKLGLTERK